MKTLKQYNEITRASSIYGVGTSLQGKIEASYSDLVEVFGEPVKCEQGKQDVEWTLQTPHGTATIYNYKNGQAWLGDEGDRPENITHWNVGGFGPEVVDDIQDALIESKGEKRKREEVTAGIEALTK